MKTARHALSAILGILLVPSGAFADNVTDSGRNTTDNPYSQYDPDGVPLAVTQGKKRKTPTRDELDNARKLQEAAAYNRNWLLRNYEEQLRLRLGDKPQQRDNPNDPYYQLSLNKDLAKLARLPGKGLDLQGRSQSPVARPATNPVPSRTDDYYNNPDSRGTKAPASLAGYKLFTPFGGADSTTKSQFTPIGTTMGISNNANNTPPPSTYTSKLPQPTDDSDLDTPGMIASKNDALSDPHATDLTLDLLPGETPEQARRAAENAKEPELPVLMDADELHRQQEAALHPHVSGDLAKKKDEQIPVAQPAPIVKEVPMPISKQQPISPVHAAIEDPYEILNR